MPKTKRRQVRNHVLWRMNLNATEFSMRIGAHEVVRLSDLVKSISRMDSGHLLIERQHPTYPWVVVDLHLGGATIHKERPE